MSGQGRESDGRMIAGRYELREALGSGGMATVYRAYQAALDRFVAVKLIDPRLASDGTFAERFRLEARIAARLRHPHILTIFDFGEDTGTLYLVTELIEGGTLQENLGAFDSFVGIVELLEPIGLALDFAHAQGIVHRDVKPANIFLEGSRPLLADFGIAKVIGGATDAGLTAAGAGIGTPEWMAPEQLLGQAIDGRADLYALAAIAYRLLTGRLPYRLEGPDDSTLALVMRKVNTSPPPPSAINPAISPTLDAILLRALSREPEARYPHARAFIAALRGALVSRHSAPASQPSGATTRLPLVPSLASAAGMADATMAQTGAIAPPPPTPPHQPQRTPHPPAAPTRRGVTAVRLGAGGALALLILVVAGGALALSRGGGNTSSPTAPIIAAATGPAPPREATSTGAASAPSPAVPPPSAAPVGSSAPPTTAAQPAQPAVDVRATAQRAILSLPGTSSGVFVNLTNSADNYADEANRVFPAASLIKLPIAGAAYQRVADGQWQLGDTFTLTDAAKVGGTGILREQPAGTTYTLDQLIEIMLVNSDNTAANMIVDRLGGFGPVNAFSQAQGMGNTVMRRQLYDLAAQERGIDNTTTSGDIARFFQRLQSGTLIDSLRSERLRDILARRGQVDKKWALLDLPPGTSALHMTGTGDNQRNDVILVTAGAKQYLLVLLVTDPNDAGIEAALTRVSATIYGVVVGR